MRPINLREINRVKDKHHIMMKESTYHDITNHKVDASNKRDSKSKYMKNKN